jgi:hypothetical protein
LDAVRDTITDATSDERKRFMSENAKTLSGGRFKVADDEPGFGKEWTRQPSGCEAWYGPTVVQ